MYLLFLIQICLYFFIYISYKTKGIWQRIPSFVTAIFAGWLITCTKTPSRQVGHAAKPQSECIDGALSRCVRRNSNVSIFERQKKNKKNKKMKMNCKKLRCAHLPYFIHRMWSGVGDGHTKSWYLLKQKNINKNKN